MNNIASPWRRIIAFLIDVAIGQSVGILLLLQIASSDNLAQLLTNLLSFLVASLFLSFLLITIRGFLTSRFGGTFGKLLTGIKVINVDGKYLSFWRSVFRDTIGYAISGILFWLGFIWIFVDKQHQGGMT